jgi:hypothetical protein
MTQKVNGMLYQGSWYEKDTSILNITGLVDLTADTINGVNQQVMNILQTRGTVIGYTVVSATEANYLFGTSAGAWEELVPDGSVPSGVNTVIDELQVAIDAATSSTCTITVFEGFAGATPAVVTHVQPDPPFTP